MATASYQDGAAQTLEPSDSLLECLDCDCNEKEVAPNVRRTKLVRDWLESGNFKPTLSADHPLAKKIASSNDPEGNKKLQQEYELLSKCKHKCIVTVFCMSEAQPMSYFVMEAGERSLYSFLHKESQLFPTANSENAVTSAYTMLRCLTWLKQIANAMDYLHNKRILHRDVKSGNVILFESSTICKVCDLDISRYDNDTVKSGGKGTQVYMAPEIDPNQPCRYSLKVDCYSFGVLMLECLTRVRQTVESVQEVPQASAFGADADEKYKFRELRRQIRLLTSREPEKRPEFRTIAARLTPDVENPLPKLEPPTLPQVEHTLKQINKPEVLSAHRTGVTLHYSVSNSESDQAITSSDKRRIEDILSLMSTQINSKAGQGASLASVRHKFTAHNPVGPNEFCRLEHILSCSEPEPERILFDYCSTDDEHCSWLSRKFVDEPGLNGLVFSVNNENPADPSANDE